jgi:hypothetical protein
MLRVRGEKVPGDEEEDGKGDFDDGVEAVGVDAEGLHEDAADHERVGTLANENAIYWDQVYSLLIALEAPNFPTIAGGPPMSAKK